MPRIRKPGSGRGNSRRNARNTDPDTSHIAAQPTDNKRVDEFIVWCEFLAIMPRDMATWQLEARLGGAQNGKWRKRLCDLAGDEWLLPVKQILNPESKRPQWTFTVNQEKRKGRQVSPSQT